MLDNATRRQLLERHKASGFPGSIIDVYNAYNQGIDLISQFEMSSQPQMQVANTPQQQQEGLRPFHQQGQTNQSMVFPNVPANQPFNTVGMKAPINIKKFDNQGHLVKSYENVPPGIENLPTGPNEGTVIETPANMQSGGQLPPIYTRDPNDPRIQMYADSLTSSNYSNYLIENAEKINSAAAWSNFLGYKINLKREREAIQAYNRLTQANPTGYTPQNTYVPNFPGGSNYYIYKFKAPVQPVIYRKENNLTPLTPKTAPSNTHSGKKLREPNVAISKPSGRDAQPIMRADFSKGIARQGQYQIGERYWDDDKKRWKEDRWSPEEIKESKRIAIEGLKPPGEYIGKFEFGYGGKRKYQTGDALPTFGKTAPDWRATGPALRVNDTIYRDHELTGATRIPIDPETGEQLPILLPTADVVGRQKYDDAITEAINRTGSGLLGEYASPEDYKKMEGAVRSGMNNAGKDLLYAAGDVLSAPQRYLVNAPLAYGLGKTPNLSMFPLADRARGINQPNAFPSETLEIKNPIGAFATDVLTDPSVAASLGVGLGRAGLKQVADKAAKYATTQTPLRNAYKINPWAFKPQKGKIYRQVGKPGFDDAIMEGKIFDKGQKEFLENNPNINYLDEYNEAINAKGLYLKKPSPAPFFSKDELFFPINRKATGTGNKKTRFSDAGYLFEGSVPEEALLPRYRDVYLKPTEATTNTFVLRPDYNDLSNFNLYKQDWLRGYRQINPPKQLPGFNTFNKYGGVRNKVPYYNKLKN